jgi:TRAP-type transport system periplasmic protein
MPKPVSKPVFKLMRSARRHVLAAMASLAVFASLSSPIAAQELRLRMAHVAPPQTTYQEAAIRFADRLKVLSKGSMSVEIIPGGTLGDLGQLWVQTRTGSLDLHLIDVSAMVAMREARAFSVMWAPFLFRDQDHLHRFLGSDLFKEMMAGVEKETGVVYLGVAGDRPPRALSTKDKAVRQPADLAGLKIRTPEHPMIISAFRAWGATPTPIRASELFVALRSGVVDGQDNGSIDFLGAGYGDVQKNYTRLDYIHSVVGIWMAGQKYAALSDQQKAWIRQATAEAGIAGRAAHAVQMQEAMAKIAAQGIAVTEPDIAAFAAASQAVVLENEGKLWPAGLFARIRAIGATP